MPSLTQRFVDRWIAWRTALLLAGLALAAASFAPARQLRFDRSIENMFAPDDPLLVPYEKLKRSFGGNEIVVAVYLDEELLHPDGRGIERLAQVRARLEAVAGVKGVVSLDQPIGESIVDPDDDRARRIRALFAGYTHNPEAEGPSDVDVSALVCMLTPESETGVPRPQVIERMRAIMRALPAPLAPGMIVGEPVMVVDGFRYVEDDGRRLSWACTLLLAATILAAFRSLRWVLVPIAVVQLTLLATKAALVGSGWRLSMVSSMLTAVVTVVSVATVVHVIVRFRESRRDGLAPRDALSRTGRLLAAPVFWSCATTAVGFFSLTLARVGPVQDFGRMMALGSLIVLPSAALLVPGLALLGRFDVDPKRVWGEGLLDRELGRIAESIRIRPGRLGLGAALIGAAAVAGVCRLEIESNFIRNFRAASPIARSYEFVETRLGGAGVWDVILPAPKDLGWDYLNRVRRLEDRLRREAVVRDEQGRTVARLEKVLSLADGMIAGSPVDLDGQRSSFRRNLMVGVGLRLFTRKMPAFAEALHGEDPEQPGQYYLRVMLRARERQPSGQKLALIDEVARISREEFPPGDDSPGAEVTGFFVLLTNLVDSVMRDQWITFGVATAGIGLMMVVAFRSLTLALVALVPNALPIVIVMGLMGWLGLKVNMGAAMIAAVSVGLSIDSSIHYVTAFGRARREGKTRDDALAAVHQTVGRAMVFSSLALIVGFSVLSTSQFVPTIYFGVLVSLSMLGGLAGNLVVLPLLLRLVVREKTP